MFIPGLKQQPLNCRRILTDVVSLSYLVTELELGTQCVVEMTGQQTILQHPTTMDKIDR